MTPKKPALLPADLWEQLAPPLQVVISAMVTHYEQRIAAFHGSHWTAGGEPPGTLAGWDH